MGKEYTRTLNNNSYDKNLSKKVSKKYSKKKSKKSNNSPESADMLKLLDSDTEVIYQSKTNNLQNKQLIPYNGVLPQQYTNQQYTNQQYTNQQYTNQQPQNMESQQSLDYDSMMLQEMAPLHNKEMFNNLQSLGAGPDIGRMNSMSQTLGNTENLQNLNMLGSPNL
jgi:hypothetical protein